MMFNLHRLSVDPCLHAKADANGICSAVQSQHMAGPNLAYSMDFDLAQLESFRSLCQSVLSFRVLSTWQIPAVCGIPVPAISCLTNPIVDSNDRPPCIVTYTAAERECGCAPATYFLIPCPCHGTVRAWPMCSDYRCDWFRCVAIEKQNLGVQCIESRVRQTKFWGKCINTSILFSGCQTLRANWSICKAKV